MKYALRSRLVNAVIQIWVWWLYIEFRIRLIRYQSDQRALAQRYRLQGCEPEPYGDSTRARIVQLATDCREANQFAWTSGTTREPKQIFYPQSRVRRLQMAFIGQVLLAYEHTKLKRPAFYVLTSMTPDNSWSSLFIRKTLPSPVTRFLLADSVIFVPGAAALLKRYSQTAVHLALWLLSDPTFMVTANPSSLYIVLEQTRQHWNRILKELEEIFAEDALTEITLQLGSSAKDRESKIRMLLNRSECPSARELLPELRVVYCWDGGYVQPFINNLRSQLTEVQPEFAPMLSLSTETIAYMYWPRLNNRGGLPIYPGVCYEFIQANQPITAQNIVNPWELEIGKQYIMIVSDSYGLKRYNTEDVFECLGLQGQAPLLRFVARTGLQYSFTGEKITAQQLLEVYETLRREQHMEGAIFTCFPRLNWGGLPAYVFVHCKADDSTLPMGLSADRFDQILMELNGEYATKRKSGRLAPPELVFDSYANLTARIVNSNRRYSASNPTQFKLLPLYKVFWEDLPDQTMKGPQARVL
jgi:hypothetical protein